MKSKKVIVPKELLCDYSKPPNNLLWKLQRLADFFPAYGTDKEIVKLLFKYRKIIKLEQGKRRLIEIYYETWNEKNFKKYC